MPWREVLEGVGLLGAFVCLLCSRDEREEGHRDR